MAAICGEFSLLGIYGSVGLLIVANTINLGADLGAMGAALKLLVGGPSLAYVVLFGLISVLLEVFMRYSRYVSSSSGSACRFSLMSRRYSWCI